MKRILHIVLLTLVLASLGSQLPADARRPKKKKAQESEQVQRIRITINLAELRDSIDAQARRYEKEIYAELDSAGRAGRLEIASRIDEITGFRKHRPGGTYLGELAVALAKEHLGKPYKWAANGPDVFDCSGFTRYIYKEIGINIPRHSGTQFEKGREIEMITDLQEGDLVFFGEARNIRKIGHVGMVVSVDREHARFSFIHASSSGGVRISPNTEDYFFIRYIGAARYIQPGK